MPIFVCVRNFLIKKFFPSHGGALKNFQQSFFNSKDFIGKILFIPKLVKFTFLNKNNNFLNK